MPAPCLRRAFLNPSQQHASRRDIVASSLRFVFRTSPSISPLHQREEVRIELPADSGSIAMLALGGADCAAFSLCLSGCDGFSRLRLMNSAAPCGHVVACGAQLSHSAGYPMSQREMPGLVTALFRQAVAHESDQGEPAAPTRTCCAVLAVPCVGVRHVLPIPSPGVPNSAPPPSAPTTMPVAQRQYPGIWDNRIRRVSCSGSGEEFHKSHNVLRLLHPPFSFLFQI